MLLVLLSFKYFLNFYLQSRFDCRQLDFLSLILLLFSPYLFLSPSPCPLTLSLSPSLSPLSPSFSPSFSPSISLSPSFSPSISLSPSLFSSLSPSLFLPISFSLPVLSLFLNSIETNPNCDELIIGSWRQWRIGWRYVTLSLMLLFGWVHVSMVLT